MRALFLLAALVLALPAQAGPVTVENLRSWTGVERTRVVLDLSGPVEHRLFTLQGPDRVVLDLEGAGMPESLAHGVPRQGLLTGVRSGRRHGDDLRVVFDLAGPAEPKSFLMPPRGGLGHRLVVDLESPPGAGESRPVKTTAERSREVVVAIDAGHGGQDPGAVGRGGSREKDIVLDVSRKLAKLVDDTPGMRAVLTRDGDYYLDLRERTRRARAANADLFLSIHADAIHDRRVQGSSVYILSRRGASTEVARLLAKRENAVDRIGGVPVEDKDEMLVKVLMDLSRGATIESSTALARTLIGELGEVNSLHKDTVEKAGFVVLKSLDMPSVLVELAFISNPAEERRLGSRAYQWGLARALHRGVQNYAARNMPTLAVEPPEDRQYVVRRGDTLSEIAQRHQVSLKRLRQANNIAGDLITVGSRLQIP